MLKWMVISALVVVLLVVGCRAAPAPAPAPAPATAPKPSPAPQPKAAPAGGSAAEFYKNNTLTLIAGLAPGGGIDSGTRMMAKFWPEVTGGDVVVKNMAGAGGLILTNHMYSEAKPDGLTLGVRNLGANIGFVVNKDPGVMHDLTKFTWIVAPFGSPYGLSIATSRPEKTMADLQKAKGLRFADMGASATKNDALLFELFGIDGKSVTGYAGSAEAGLALGRGEADVINGPGSALRTEHNKGFVKLPSLIIGYERTTWFPDTPALPELVKLTPQQEPLFAIMTALNNGAMAVFTPPGVPADRAAFLRTKFAEILALPELRKTSTTVFPIWTEPMTAAQIEALIKKTLAVPQEDITRLRQVFAKHAPK